MAPNNVAGKEDRGIAQEHRLSCQLTSSRAAILVNGARIPVPVPEVTEKRTAPQALLGRKGSDYSSTSANTSIASSNNTTYQTTVISPADEATSSRPAQNPNRQQKVEPIDSVLNNIKNKIEDLKLQAPSTTSIRRNPVPTSWNKNRFSNLKPRNTAAKEKQQPSGPLKEFHLFGKLAVEIRVKIWHLHIWNSPHLIEIEKGPGFREGHAMPTQEVIVGTHSWYRVSPRSRIPPAILRVCFESRAEAMRVYKLTNFDYQTNHIRGREMWFNPAVDIIYFGEDTCLATIIHMKKTVDIRRMAFNVTGRITQCHDFDEPLYAVDGGVNPMQALHGFHGEREQDTQDGLYSGIHSLQEVFLVVQSNLSTTDGLTRGQKGLKSWMMAEIDVVNSGGMIYGVGENMWVDDKKPTFHWVSLSPQDGVDGIYYDGLGVDDAAVKFLNRRVHVLDAISRRTECHIYIPNKTFPKEFPREIGFSGTRKAIEEAKAEIIKKIAQSEGSVVPVSSRSD
ncbi:hypothetical protein GLAREA_06951 [Glarea lozoyensis ATCC 20868]|uniref:2EXR domain-containing protein n=1 Tax=Glarea lozoyensis (strain ATCC 20868 / MF5171) TaxID=1116229 RepID=S3E6D9_GLAL2|nr:uncharacterized protein GLAREA_06951 [Glarea lozoyensis ATCC 20868]EPE33938.1 hypothetical protein GLAREA_06951 [Glarea lozoyensis ATCC 20868]